jgi:hypothetical protein
MWLLIDEHIASAPTQPAFRTSTESKKKQEEEEERKEAKQFQVKLAVPLTGLQAMGKLSSTIAVDHAAGNGRYRGQYFSQNSSGKKPRGQECLLLVPKASP